MAKPKKTIETSKIKPLPNLPSTPHKLVFISLEKTVDNRKESRIKRIPPSRTVFTILTRASHINFTNSKPTITVENERITKDIALSDQSQGKGMIENGRQNTRKKRIYF